MAAETSFDFFTSSTIKCLFTVIFLESTFFVHFLITRKIFEQNFATSSYLHCRKSKFRSNRANYLSLP